MSTSSGVLLGDRNLISPLAPDSRCFLAQTGVRINSQLPSKLKLLKSSEAFIPVTTNLSSTMWAVETKVKGSSPSEGEHRQSRGRGGVSVHGCSYTRREAVQLASHWNRPRSGCWTLTHRRPPVCSRVILILTRSPRCARNRYVQL